MPNCATAGAKSQDRTEPNGGAKVLLEFWKKWGDKWLVELLFDDLLDASSDACFLSHPAPCHSGAHTRVPVCHRG